MIQIEIPGKGFLQLPASAALSLRLNNPIFADDDFIPGDYSFPFDVDAGDSNGHNANLLSHPDVPENAAGTYEIPGVNLYIDHLLYRTGKLVVSKSTGNKASLNFSWGINNIRADFGTTKIRDLVEEEVVITTETYHKAAVIDFDGMALASYKVKVNDTVFENLTMSGLATDINADARFTAEFKSTGDDWGVTGDRILIAPATGATDITTEFTVNFEPAENVWRWHITINPENDFYFWFADFLDDQYVNPTPYLFWPYVYAAGYLPGIHDINAVNSGGYIFSGNNGYQGSVYAPFLSLKHLMDSITTEFGIIFDGDFFTSDWYDRALFWNTNKMAALQKYGREWEYLFLYNSFNVRDLVPDLTVEELLKGLQKKWNLSVVFSQDGTRISINNRKPVVLDNTFIDWTAMSSPPQEIDFGQFVTGYKLISPRQQDDFNDADDTYIIGTPTQEINGIIGSIKSDIGGSIVGPYPGQAAGSDFIPRLFFYIGEVTENGITYHKASHKNPEVNYGGATGLGETVWKDWLNVLKSRLTVTFTIKLDFRHINRIDWSRKVMIDGVPYLIKSIDVRIKSSGFEPAKVVMYKV